LILLISSFANAQQRIKEYKASNQVVLKKRHNHSREDLVLMEILYLFKSGWAVGVTPQGIGSAYSGLNVIIKKNKTSYF
jgi:hypothetical protein